MTASTEYAARLVTALQKREAAKSEPSDNPLATQTLEGLIGGVRKGADNYPAKRNTTEAAIAMEAARVAGLEVGRIGRANQRKKAARVRKTRKDQILAAIDEGAIDEAAASTTPMLAARVEAAWDVITPLYPIVEAVSGSKRRWVQRYLGDLTADVVSMTVERMLRVLVHMDVDLNVLRESAEAILSKEPAPVLPEDATDEDRKHRKQVGNGCSFVMGVVNNCVMQALDAAYRSDENMRWENLDTLDTVLNSANGSQEDGFIARFKADRAPLMSGWRWAQPGQFDPALLDVALDAAITDRRLDPLVELFIAEGNTHPNGLFKWEELASKVFLLAPDNGEWLWDAVLASTRDHVQPEKAQARAAKMYVATLFEWMPGFIVDACNALPNLPFGDGKRYPLVPALSYATAMDAAEAIMEVLA